LFQFILSYAIFLFLIRGYFFVVVNLVIRLSPPSQPNNIRRGLKCPSRGTYVRTSTKFFSDFNEIWYVDRGR